MVQVQFFSVNQLQCKQGGVDCDQYGEVGEEWIEVYVYCVIYCQYFDKMYCLNIDVQCEVVVYQLYFGV